MVYRLLTEHLDSDGVDAFDEWLLEPVTAEGVARKAAVLAYAQEVFGG